MRSRVSDSEQVLFETYYSRVFRAVYLFCGSYNMTEDATQEAFYRACKNLHQLRDKSAFSAWVTTIAVNIVKTEYKKQNKICFVDFEKVAHEIKYDRDDYETIEVKEDVRQLLCSLDDDQREVLILRYLFDLSYSQISAIKNLSDAAVKSRLFRAKQKVRDLYQKVGLTYEK